MSSKIASITRRLRWPMVCIIALWAYAKWGPMDPLFNTPKSTVLLDRDGQLVGATVAADEQWRMPASDSIPKKFEACIVEFEDRNFRSHWGIHVPSIMRALQQNYRAGRVVSGGSTITMQVARMAMEHRARNVWNKLSELFLALRMELRYSKNEILELYTENAPFGANVVGLEAAAWRWYGRDPFTLSWGEYATLAVLPNAPSQMHPGTGRDALLAKRDRLLQRLLINGTLDSLQWQLAAQEPLPDAPVDLPRIAPHLLATMQHNGYVGKRIHSSVDRALQQRVTGLTERYSTALRANEIHNAAVLVLDVRTGETLAYIGNLPSAGKQHGGAVDIVQARRSTGSLLKPFLYADMLDAGERMPDELVADLPTYYEGFAPQNYEHGFDGAVPASEALARSLNIPAVRALREHGIERTLKMLRALGLDHIDRSANNYGLSLIIGGAESTLWELTGAYADMARVVANYSGDAILRANNRRVPTMLLNGSEQKEGGPYPLTPAALYHTLCALQKLNRPSSETGWQHFGNNERIAWKTGTSFGHRDAWAIGVTDRYAVGVWTGNASGEGRPGLTGTLAAAPLLFEVFSGLPKGKGFDPPYDQMEQMVVCAASGFRAGNECTPVDTSWIISTAKRTMPCPYHQRILVNATGTERVGPGPNAHPVSWFVLPPAMEFYYSEDHHSYKQLPQWAANATPTATNSTMELIYPEHNAQLYIPITLSGEPSAVVLKAVHRNKNARLFWDLDGEPIGTTQNPHELTTLMKDGAHVLTLTDDTGARSVRAFSCRTSGGR